MKRAILILLALLMVLSLVGCAPKNDIFIKLRDYPNYNQIEKVTRRESFIEDMTTSYRFYTNDYSFLGYNGYMTIRYFEDSGSLNYATWTLWEDLNAKEKDKMVQKFVKYFTKQYGEPIIKTSSSGNRYYAWYDNYGYEYIFTPLSIPNSSFGMQKIGH